MSAVQRPRAGDRPSTTDHFDSHLLDHAQTALIALDAEGCVTHWNNYATVLYGFQPEEAGGVSILELIVPPSQRETFSQALDAAHGGKVFEGDLKLAPKDASPLHTHVTLSQIADPQGEAPGFVMVSFDISERKRTEQRLAVHYEITQVLAEAEHIYEAAPRLLEAVCRTLEWSFGAVWQVDRLGDEMRCLDIWKDPLASLSSFEEVTRWMTFKKGEGLPGRAWATRGSLWIKDVQVDVAFPRRSSADEVGLHSAFVFPILLRGDVLGVLEFFSHEIRKPDEDLLQLMGSVGSQLGQFMERKHAEEDRRMSDARKTAILESSLDSIITMDHLGYVLEFNSAAEDTFGYRREDVVGKEMAELIIPPHLRDAHRKGLLNYLETGDGPVVGRRIEITAMRSDGVEFPVELTVTRVEIPGPPVFSGYLRDITQRKESELERLSLLEAEQKARTDAEKASARLRRLQRITDAALSYLSVDELLDEVLDRIMETLRTDVSAILLVREETSDLTVRALKGMRSDISKIPPVPIGEQAAGIVAQTGQPIIVGDLLESDIDAPLLKQEGMQSLLAVPLMIENRTFGVLITTARDAGRFSDEDLMLLRLAADRIASPIQNASLFEREHRIATSLQRSLLPTKLPQLPGLSVRARYEPGGQGLDVGGDWYDAMVLPDGKVGMVIGDVVGKGVGAASVMGQLRNALRAFALEGGLPSEVVGRLNRLTDSFDRTTMATMIYLDFDPITKIIQLANAGHPPPLIASADGKTRFLEGERNLPLGVLNDHVFLLDTVEVNPGDLVLMYTDGLIEEPGESIEEGMERLRQAVEDGPKDLDALCDHVLREVFGDRDRSDDVAILALRTAG